MELSMKLIYLTMLLGAMVTSTLFAEDGNGTLNQSRLYDDVTAATFSSLTFSAQSEHQMVLHFDGTIEIDGQPIERLSDPEIKEALKSIAQSLQNDQLGMMKHYERQMELLLHQLAECKEKLQGNP